MSLPRPDLLVLAILGEQPSHGWAVAQLTARDGELGRIWHVPKAIIYRGAGSLFTVAASALAWPWSGGCGMRLSSVNCLVRLPWCAVDRSAT
jgi:hypothetical protein